MYNYVGCIYVCVYKLKYQQKTLNACAATKAINLANIYCKTKSKKQKRRKQAKKDFNCKTNTHHSLVQ